jgi:hypothetical protein
VWDIEGSKGERQQRNVLDEDVEKVKSSEVKLGG